MKSALDVLTMIIIASVGVAVILHAGNVATLVTTVGTQVTSLSKTLSTQ